ncbi:MAG: J domain-containing protein [Acidimicrobiales bacterium]
MADAGLYERLGVDPDADLAALRAAYRRLARELHPDLHHGGGIETQLRMAMVNEAWAVLSDPDRRAAYDAERRRAAAAATAAATAAAAERHRSPAPVIRPQTNGGARLIVTRKDAWINGLAVRIRFLVGYAGRSAVQAMLLRHPGTARPDWEALVPLVCAEASRDAGEHIRAARAAGAAPLDLANAAALLGLHAYGERLVVGPLPLSAEDRYRHAEMVDRVYETLAYELPRELVHELGNAPRAVRRLQGRR